MTNKQKVIIEMYEAGDSVYRIAKQLDTSRWYVYEVIKKYDISRKTIQKPV